MVASEGYNRMLDLAGGTEKEIHYIEWSISHEGKGFLFLDYMKNQEGFDFRRDKLEWLPNSREMAGTAASGLVVNNDLETEIKGLFAAGDEVGGVPWSASLERKESRLRPFGFYRADYPEEDNKDYFAFLAMRRLGDKIKFSEIRI